MKIRLNQDFRFALRDAGLTQGLIRKRVITPNILLDKIMSLEEKPYYLKQCLSKPFDYLITYLSKDPSRSEEKELLIQRIEKIRRSVQTSCYYYFLPLDKMMSFRHQSRRQAQTQSPSLQNCCITSFKNSPLRSQLSFKFFDFVLDTVKTLTEEELTNSILRDFKNLDKLIQHARQERYFSIIQSRQLREELTAYFYSKIFFKDLSEEEKWEFLFDFLTDTTRSDYSLKDFLLCYEKEKSFVLIVTAALQQRASRLDPYEIRRCYSRLKSDADLSSACQNIRMLNLKSMGLSVLTREIFSLFPRLRNLDLSLNQLTYVEEGSFDDLTWLRSLNLNSNKLQKLPRCLFKKLIHLHELYLSENCLIEIEEETLKEVKKLKNLNLSLNRLKKLPPNIFQNLEQLQHLFLSHNRLKNLDSELLSSLENLETLDLSFNLIEALPGNMFQNLNFLHNLNLRKNNLTEISEDYFIGLDDLEELDLSFNNIKNCSGGSFQALLFLTCLDLSHNKINTLPQNIFSCNIGLVELDLSHNHLKTLSEDLFVELNDLSELNLSHNHLIMLPSNLFGVNEKLEYLSLSHNRLSRLSRDVFARLINLKDLMLHHNKLSEDNFLNLPSGPILIINNNRSLSFR